MTLLSNKEIDDLITDYLQKLSKAKQEGNQEEIKAYEYQIRLLEVAYNHHDNNE